MPELKILTELFLQEFAEIMFLLIAAYLPIRHNDVVLFKKHQVLFNVKIFAELQAVLLDLFVELDKLIVLLLLVVDEFLVLHCGLEILHVFTD
jgi:hypothetical protein